MCREEGTSTASGSQELALKWSPGWTAVGHGVITPWTVPEHHPKGVLSPLCPTGTAAVGQGQQIQAWVPPGRDCSVPPHWGSPVVCPSPGKVIQHREPPFPPLHPSRSGAPRQEGVPGARGGRGAAQGGQGRAGPILSPPAARTAPHRACCSRRRHCSLRSGYSRSLTASNLLPQHSGPAGAAGWGLSHRDPPPALPERGEKSAPPTAIPGTPGPLGSLPRGPAARAFPPLSLQGIGPLASSRFLPGCSSTIRPGGPALVPWMLPGCFLSIPDKQGGLIPQMSGQLPRCSSASVCRAAQPGDGDRAHPALGAGRTPHRAAL